VHLQFALPPPGALPLTRTITPQTLLMMAQTARVLCQPSRLFVAWLVLECPFFSAARCLPAYPPFFLSGSPPPLIPLLAMPQCRTSLFCHPTSLLGFRFSIPHLLGLFPGVGPQQNSSNCVPAASQCATRAPAACALQHVQPRSVIFFISRHRFSVPHYATPARHFQRVLELL
jgi:hypothetical protein